MIQAIFCFICQAYCICRSKCMKTIQLVFVEMKFGVLCNYSCRICNLIYIYLTLQASQLLSKKLCVHCRCFCCRCCCYFFFTRPNTLYTLLNYTFSLQCICTFCVALRIEVPTNPNITFILKIQLAACCTCILRRLVLARKKIALNKCQNAIWNIFIWITTISHLRTSDDMPFRFTLIENQCFDFILHPLHNTKIYKITSNQYFFY